MRVSWTDTGKGRFAPLLTVGFRRHGTGPPTNQLLLVDTGADGTVLPRYNAKFLGFNAAELRPEECGVPGGKITVHRPPDITGTEIEIHGNWLPLPSLVFADQILHPLLGRDIIFKYFDLQMTGSDFELIPI
jgi:hypothetical protein